MMIANHDMCRSTSVAPSIGDSTNVEGDSDCNRVARSDSKRHSSIQRWLGRVKRNRKLIEARWLRADRIKIDPSVVRGLEYYTGPVFEVELTVRNQRRQRLARRFGSVGGGGRYDGLVSRFRGEPVPATGFSIGVSRLQAALTAARQARRPKPSAGPVRGHRVRHGQHRRLPEAGRDAAQRRHPRRALSRQSEAGIGQQLKYADKRNAPCAVIQGPDEKAKGEVRSGT